MRNFKLTGKTAIAAMCLLCFVLPACDDVIKQVEIAPNQIWVKEYEADNQFEQIRRDTVIVLDVQNGYVKYIRHGETKSDKIWWVTVNARRVK